MTPMPRMKRKSKWSLLVFAGDAVIIPLSFIAGHYIRFGNFQELSLKLPVSVLCAVTAGYLGIFYFFDLYRLEAHYFRLPILAKHVLGVASGFLIILALNYGIFLEPIGRGISFWANIAIFLLFFGWRILCRRLFKFFLKPRKTVIIGAEEAGRETARLLLSLPDEYEILGFLNEDESRAPDAEWGRPWPAGPEQAGFVETAEHLEIDLIVFAVTGDIPPALSQDLLSARLRGVEVVDMRDLFQTLKGRLPLPYVTEAWLLKAKGFAWSEKSIGSKMKRIIDVVFSALFLVVSLPLWPIIALAIKINSRGPVFYTQKRVGQNEEVFSLYKFRSMIAQAEKDEPLWATENDQRITRTGRVLRKLHLDEWPQFFNVLKGDMSLVGPRPERPEFVDSFRQTISFYSLRHFLHPGLTGWAQVNYPYASSREATIRKLEYDLYYIYHASLLLDLQILLKTAQNILLRRKHRTA